MLKTIILGLVLISPLCPIKKEYPLINNNIEELNNINEICTYNIKTFTSNDDEVEDPQETIYDLYSKEDIEILFRIVEAECTGQSIDSKMNVANVIINRVNSEDFPNSIKDIVFQKCNGYYQFTPILDKRYWSVEITDDTIIAVENIFLQDDTTDGALFFCNKKTSEANGRNWMERNLEYIFTDDANHSFYK